jgi:LEA14-like dessication related protein
LLGSAGMTGCAVADAMGLRRPGASFKGVALRDINLQSATLEFQIEITNPYSVPLPLANVDYSLASGGSPFLSGKADIQDEIPAGSAKVVLLPVKIVYMDVIHAIKNIRPGAVLPYEAELGLSVRTPAVGELRVPLHKSGEIPVPAPPDIQVTEIAWRKLDLNQAEGVIRLSATNRNRFPVSLSRFEYALSLADIPVAQSVLSRGVDFPADGGTGEIEIPISFSPTRLGLGLLKTLMGSGSGYRLQGEWDVNTSYGTIRMPIDKAGKTSFRR